MDDCYDFSFSTAVSGGSFDLYLESITSQFGTKVRLQIYQLQHRFPLPSFDGQGQKLSKDELDGILQRAPHFFSTHLLCNYIYLREENCIILFDDDSSLEKKAERANKHAISIK